MVDSIAFVIYLMIIRELLPLFKCYGFSKDSLKRTRNIDLNLISKRSNMHGIVSFVITPISIEAMQVCRIHCSKILTDSISSLLTAICRADSLRLVNSLIDFGHEVRNFANISTMPPEAAMCNGVKPSLPCMLTSSRLISTSRSTVFVWLFCNAKWIGV